MTQSLAAALIACGLDPHGITVLRTSLHPDDRDSDFRTSADLVRLNGLSTYERLHDGRAIADHALVLTTLAEPQRTTRITGLKRFRLRHNDTIPGDIIYDYDAAHLLHSFLARARRPRFYDTQDDPRLGSLNGRRLLWPLPAMIALRPATHPDLALLPD